MMPIEDSSVESSKDSKSLVLEVTEMAPFEPYIEEQKGLLSILETISNPKEFEEVLNLKSSENVSIDHCKKLDAWEECNIKSDLNTKLDKEFSSSKLDISSAQYVFPKRSLSELESCSIQELNLKLKQLSQVIEKVSSELVQLLLENDALQQESDARNVAIEQLLKMTVKNSEVELRPIQMSVIIPDNDDNNDN